ncbi:protein FAM161A [Archocentrus centrarchus]|uniref:protein FAM161A n=1 Tax=Archocentrus centrarchus TaxID=63155 RepID=UPI0011EA492C|nr:protein FAM161A-like [Archocentrus centrarchus]XP_030604381.1 protein FAM161A-like [Archocentrus centrarchus]
MAVMYRSPFLENKELVALYGGERDCYFDKDEDCISEEYELESESSEEGKGGRGIRSSLSLEIYGLQREQHVHFSNQEYYRRLEDLKSNHLRNMAELERMYISQGKERNGGGDDGCLERNKDARQLLSGPARRLQRINSQEELDFHESSSSSDHSEHCGEDSMGELAWTPSQERIFERDVLLSPERMMNQNQFRFQPTSSSPKSQGRVSKVTVPKPFQMMLREEERKKHKVRTRSEIELENMLLRRELEELRECQKKFRASPAPAHIHLPLYEIISRRNSQRSDQSRSSSKKNRNPDANNNQTSTAVLPQPFHFLERERRKREAKIVEELGNFGQKMERQTFKARPLPISIYGTRHREGPMTTSCSLQSQKFYMLEREANDGQSDQSSDPELDMQQSDSSLNSCTSQRSLFSKPVKKQIELSIEMVKQRERPNADPSSCKSWVAQSFC